MRTEVKDEFDELSPITGELSVLIEDNFRLDLATGYQNLKDQWLTDKPEVLKEIESSLPDYIVRMKFIDTETKNVWYPMVSFKHTAALYPIDSKTDGYIWVISKVSKIENEDEIKTHATINLPIKIAGKDQIGIFKIENELLMAFKKNEFELAYEQYCNL